MCSFRLIIKKRLFGACTQVCITRITYAGLYFFYLPSAAISRSKYIFACIRFSIWLDSKLRLQTDPILILEYFLWRQGYEYAISNHYDRHCVWEEVAQNKKLNKFNHTIIDQQFEFYQADGLTRFNPSDPNKLLPSCMFIYLLVLILMSVLY